MVSHTGISKYLALVVVCLAGFTSFPALTEEADVEEIIVNKPGITHIISRILADPHRNYQRVQGPDDCNSEELYLGTRKVLEEYSANPAENKSTLRDYILSGQAACNCTRAIIGKDIDFLVKDVDMDMSELPCI